MRKLGKQVLSSILLSLLVVSSVIAAPLISEEICGDGIDNTQAYIGLSCPIGWVPAKVDPLTNSQTTPGCDLLCPAADQDNDGYLAVGHCSAPNCDADDTDRFIYPDSGPTTKGCSGGQVRYPQGDGSFTACAAWACPVGRNCKYLSPSGNDTTGDGTIGNPWRTLGKISYWNTTAPFTVYTPQANDLFILRGGSYNTTYNFAYGSTDANIFICRNNGALNVGFWAYPGEKPVVNNSATFNSAIWLEGCARQEWLGIQFVTSGVGLHFAGTNFYTKNIIATAPNANGDNHACIYSQNTVDSFDQSSILYDCYKSVAASSPNVFNNANWVDFRSTNLQAKRTTSFYTTYVVSPVNGSVAGSCFKLSKHSDYGNSKIFDGVVAFNCAIGALNTGSPNVVAQYSRLAHVSTAVNSADIGGPTYLTGQLNSGIAFDFNRNTVWGVRDIVTARANTKQYNINGTVAADECSGDVTIGTFRVRNNYFESIRASYNQDNRFHTHGPYKPDQLRLISDYVYTNNTNYSPNAAISFGINESNNGNLTCSGRGNDGQNYTWAQWQAAGFDTTASGSSLENCVMDQFQRCTAVGTQDTGWRLLSEEPTPTPTPTPVPGAPNRGNSIGRMKF